MMLVPPWQCLHPAAFSGMRLRIWAASLCNLKILRLTPWAFLADKKSGYKFANEKMLLKTQRAIEYMKKQFPDTLTRFSFIAEFNRMHVFALDENFQVLNHVIAHSDGYFIPNSGPLWRDKMTLSESEGVSTSAWRK